MNIISLYNHNRIHLPPKNWIIYPSSLNASLSGPRNNKINERIAKTEQSTCINSRAEQSSAAAAKEPRSLHGQSTPRRLLEHEGGGHRAGDGDEAGGGGYGGGGGGGGRGGRGQDHPRRSQRGAVA
uniref:Uncharacterized protein n=1 Tax=Arundo donax TaxID=35708 RepID=A0A0A9DNZ9_ARUDO